jgi:hypothetical protein
MNATTTKQKFLTLDAALSRIDELEAGSGDGNQARAQITSLTAELAARNIEIRALKTASAGQQTAPLTTQTPTVKPIDQMSSVELTIACDQAAQAGDKVAADQFYKEYETRKANRS